LLLKFEAFTVLALSWRPADCNRLRTLYMLYFRDRDNETVYSTWNSLQR